MSSRAILTWLHIAQPAVLAIPVLSLLTHPPRPYRELPGIRPITVRIVRPRRFGILTCLSLLAFSSLLDAVILVAEFLTSKHHLDQSATELASAIVYPVGGFLIWSLTAIFAEWRQKWGKRPVVFVALLSLIGEIINMAFLIRRLRGGELLSPLKDRAHTLRHR